MLRGSAGRHLRLVQHALLARAAPPLLAACAREAFLGGARARSLHVFARRPNAHHTKVEVHDGADAGDLKDAVCAKLKLDAPPDSVSLLREAVGGGAPVPLDSRVALADQWVLDGTSVVVEMLRPPAALVRLRGSLVPFKVVLAPGADARDLAKAAIAELRLDVAPGSVRLLREAVGGGAPVPLDSCVALADQGVLDGTSVVVEVITTTVDYRASVYEGAPRSMREDFTAASFAKLLQKCTMYHMRTAEGEDKPQSIILNLEMAVAVCSSGSGDYLLMENPFLMLRDPSQQLRDDVFNLR